MIADSDLIRQKSSSEGGWGDLQPISGPPEQGIAIRDLVCQVVRGWKVLLGAGLIAGLLGAWVVYAFPRRYEARLKLTVSPAEQLWPVVGSMLGVAKPSEELLQEYATWLSAPEVLEQATSQLRQHNPAWENISETELQEIISIVPIPREGRLEISALTADQELAKLVVAKLARCGVDYFEQLRISQQKAVQQALVARVESARRAYQKTQEELSRLRQDQKYIEKKVHVQLISRRVESLQQLLLSTEIELPKLQTKLWNLESLLLSVPPTTCQTFRWDTKDPLIGLLASQLGQQDMPGLILLWESPSELFQDTEKYLLYQHSELEALQTAQAKAQTTLREAVAELEKAQTEMEELNASISLAQAELQSARARYMAAKEALAKWQEDPLCGLPCVRMPPESWILVQPKGLSALQRWIGIELLGLAFGVVAIFLTDELRRRTPQMVCPPATSEAPSVPAEQPISMPTKLSA